MTSSAQPAKNIEYAPNVTASPISVVTAQLKS